MASYTEHLQLLKKDPVADGADTFNIQTMLNDNWDKIDEVVAKKAVDSSDNGSITTLDELLAKRPSGFYGVSPPATGFPRSDYWNVIVWSDTRVPSGGNYTRAIYASPVNSNELWKLQITNGGNKGWVRLVTADELSNHVNNKSNPHGVTAEQLNALGLTMNTYANLDDMPEKLLIALTNKDGVSGLPDGWPQNRNAFIRFFTGNIAYSLDLLANYANKKLAYRFAKDQWASLVTEAELAGKAEVHLFSYMGTGTYEGDINAGGVSVTADKPILMVGVLMRKENSTGEFYPTTSTRSSDNNANTIILTSPLTTEYTEGTGLGDPYGSTTNAKLYAKKSLDGKTVYWTCRYSTSYYGGQYGFAEEGYTYYGFYIC